MTYRLTTDYLFSQLPMFHRIGAAAYKANLDNTLALCEMLGNPEKEFKSIHIAGTNGKGSVSHFLASVSVAGVVGLDDGGAVVVVAAGSIPKALSLTSTKRRYSARSSRPL